MGGRSGFGKENWKLGLGNVKFKMSIRCSHRGEQQIVRSVHLGLKRNVRASDKTLDVISTEVVFTTMELSKII